MDIRLRRSVVCASLILLGSSFGLETARAQQPPTVVRSVRIDISDLDLARPRDRRTLHRRLEGAAKQVCGPGTFSVLDDPPGYLGYDTCYRNAVKQALAQVEARDLQRRRSIAKSTDTSGTGRCWSSDRPMAP